MKSASETPAAANGPDFGGCQHLENFEISGLSKVDGLKYINKYLFIYLFL